MFCAEFFTGRSSTSKLLFLLSGTSALTSPALVEAASPALIAQPSVESLAAQTDAARDAHQTLPVSSIRQFRMAPITEGSTRYRVERSLDHAPVPTLRPVTAATQIAAITPRQKPLEPNWVTVAAASADMLPPTRRPERRLQLAGVPVPQTKPPFTVRVSQNAVPLPVPRPLGQIEVVEALPPSAEPTATPDLWLNRHVSPLPAIETVPPTIETAKLDPDSSPVPAKYSAAESVFDPPDDFLNTLPFAAAPRRPALVPVEAGRANPILSLLPLTAPSRPAHHAERSSSATVEAYPHIGQIEFASAFEKGFSSVPPSTPISIDMPLSAPTRPRPVEAELVSTISTDARTERASAQPLGEEQFLAALPLSAPSRSKEAADTGRNGLAFFRELPTAPAILPDTPSAPEARDAAPTIFEALGADQELVLSNLTPFYAVSERAAADQARIKAAPAQSIETENVIESGAAMLAPISPSKAADPILSLPRGVEAPSSAPKLSEEQPNPAFRLNAPQQTKAEPERDSKKRESALAAAHALDPAPKKPTANERAKTEEKSTKSPLAETPARTKIERTVRKKAPERLVRKVAARKPATVGIVTGYLRAPSGEPVSLAAGVAQSLDREGEPPHELFTNWGGRFALFDAEPGRYRVVIDDLGEAEIVVPDSSDGQKRLGSFFLRG